MTDPSQGNDKNPDITTETPEEEIWGFIDRVLVDTLTADVANQHINENRNVEITALDIKHKLPQEDHDYQNEMLTHNPVSIAEAIGTDIVPRRLAKPHRSLPTQSMSQFAYKQAILCLSCFIASELDAYISNSPDDAQRIFDIEDKLQFHRDDVLEPAKH